MNTSNKLLLGLLLTVLLFVTVLLGTARFHVKKGKFSQEQVTPANPSAVPEAPAPPALLSTKFHFKRPKAPRRHLRYALPQTLAGPSSLCSAIPSVREIHAI